MMTPSIKVIPSNKLAISEPDPRWFGNGPNTPEDPHWTNGNWLKSRFHFAFAEYANSQNTHYGVMRVMNDDLVQPSRGFGTHPHRDMEIITYIVHGSLTHEDSMGTQESLGRGSIQFMTAGTGITHSEFNLDESRPLRFIQTWILPSSRGLKPNYGSYSNTSTCSDDAGVGSSSSLNELRHLVSDSRNPAHTTPVEISQDIDIYAAELELGKNVTLELPPNRQAYMLCIEGELGINNKDDDGALLKKYDAAEINADKGGILNIAATGVEKVDEIGRDVAHVLIFVMKAVPGDGRTDF